MKQKHTLIAFALIAAVTLAVSLGYFIGQAQPQGTYVIRGDEGTAIPGSTQSPTASPAAPPSPGESPSETPQETPAPPADERVNVNTADISELQRLPGVGPAIAQRIIDFRERYGSFVSAQDLLNVSGIGEITLANMYDMITW